MCVGALSLLVARGERWGLPLYAGPTREAWAELKQYTQPAHHVDWVCQQHVLDPAMLFDAKCEFGSGDAQARILLLGDSHGAQFAPLLRMAAEAQGVRIRAVALGGCAPLVGSLEGVVVDSRVKPCELGVQKVLKRARDFPQLIIGAAWAGYAGRSPDVWTRLELQLRTLVARGHRVWLLPRVPEFSDYDAACHAKRQRVGEWLNCPAVLTPRDDGAETNARLAEIAQRVPGVRFEALHETLCTGRVCPVADSRGHYLYADNSHLSVYGSKQLAAELTRTGRLPDLLKVFNP